MRNAHSLGRFFIVFGVGQAGGSPPVDRAVTTEREGEMRVGAGFLIRAPFTGHRPTRGVVIGRWRAPTASGNEADARSDRAEEGA